METLKVADLKPKNTVYFCCLYHHTIKYNNNL